VTWQAEIGLYPPENFVWLDESLSDDITMHCTSRWASMGQACVRQATFLQGKRYSILPALTLDGVIAMDLFEGSVTKEKFMSFLQNHLVCNLAPFYLHFIDSLYQRLRNSIHSQDLLVLWCLIIVPSIMMRIYSRSLKWKTVCA
jgi:hypothetical protein